MIERSNMEQKAIELLHEGNYSIVVIKGTKQFTSTKRGIAPILELIDTDLAMLEAAIVADKVIGKAAALLLAYGNIQSVYADILSEHAIQILDQYHIAYTYHTRVPYIINRMNTGMCPMESRVLTVNDAMKAPQLLKQAVAEMMVRK